MKKTLKYIGLILGRLILMAIFFWAFIIFFFFYWLINGTKAIVEFSKAISGKTLISNSTFLLIKKQ